MDTFFDRGRSLFAVEVDTEEPSVKKTKWRKFDESRGPPRDAPYTTGGLTLNKLENHWCKNFDSRFKIQSKTTPSKVYDDTHMKMNVMYISMYTFTLKYPVHVPWSVIRSSGFWWLGKEAPACLLSALAMQMWRCFPDCSHQNIPLLGVWRILQNSTEILRWSCKIFPAVVLYHLV